MWCGALKSMFNGRISVRQRGDEYHNLMTGMAPSVRRVLVVEDVQETRDAIEGLLKRDGYSVDQAKGEDEAVERSRWNRPDLILISLGGAADQVLRVARSIRARARLTEQIPIVIFSIATVPEGAEQEIEGNIHITLPDNFNQLRALLARVLHGTSRK